MVYLACWLVIMLPRIRRLAPSTAVVKFIFSLLGTGFFVSILWCHVFCVMASHIIHLGQSSYSIIVNYKYRGIANSQFMCSVTLNYFRALLKLNWYECWYYWFLWLISSKFVQMFYDFRYFFRRLWYVFIPWNNNKLVVHIVPDPGTRFSLYPVQRLYFIRFFTRSQTFFF